MDDPVELRLAEIRGFVAEHFDHARTDPCWANRARIVLDRDGTPVMQRHGLLPPIAEFIVCTNCYFRNHPENSHCDGCGAKL